MGYMKTHMTGHQIGDTVEAEALVLSFGRPQAAAACNPSIATGVKTNTGHTSKAN